VTQVIMLVSTTALIYRAARVAGRSVRSA